MAKLKEVEKLNCETQVHLFSGPSLSSGFRTSNLSCHDFETEWKCAATAVKGRVMYVLVKAKQSMLLL